MNAVLAVSAGQWVIIALAGLIALAGFALMVINLVPLLVPRKPGEPPKPLMGPPKPIPRRTFFGRVMLAGFGAAVTNFGAVSLAFLWPNLGGGFGGKVTLATPLGEILAQMKASKEPFYFAPGRFYLVPYDDADPKAKLYKAAGLTAGGVMALYQRCVHLGCRVPFCATSQWFECPCHGSKYNKAGEYKLGPAPRGLDRFPITIENGIVTIDTGLTSTGPPRGTNTSGQEPEGPFCVEQDSAEEAEAGHA